jgi:capsule polysaccharide export protein KpsE/RkpR
MLKFLKLITKWRKLFIINIVIVTILSVVVSLFLPNWYRASAIVKPPTGKGASSGLAGLLGSLPLGGLGINLGVGGGEDFTYMAILKSRSLATHVIRQFNLMDFYERETMEETLKDFFSDYDVQPTEENMIEISYQYTDSTQAAKIVNYIVDELGKRFLKLSLQVTELEKSIIEKRYIESVETLDSLLDSLANFQKQYGIIEFTEQTKALMNAAADIEAELIMKKAELNSYENLLGKEHPYSVSSRTELQSLEDEFIKIKSKNTADKEKPFKSLFVPFEKIPEIGKEYAKLYSNFLLQSKLQEFILPQLEQAKLKLLQDTPSIEVIDKAVPPDYKSKPRRSIIVIVAIALAFILTYLVVLIIEYLFRLKHTDNQQYLDWIAIKNSWLKPSSYLKK